MLMLRVWVQCTTKTWLLITKTTLVMTLVEMSTLEKEETGMRMKVIMGMMVNTILVAEYT